MASMIYCTTCMVMLLVVSINCNLLKKSTDDCNTTECVLSTVNVTLHQYAAMATMTTLPGKAKEDNLAVSLIGNMTTTLQKHLKTMSSNMAVFFGSVVDLLHNQLSVLSQRLPMPLARDCQTIATHDIGAVSGPYRIAPADGIGSLIVYCDMDTANGGWTVFQRRFDGSVRFYRGWNEYVRGFGSPDGEYWAGLRQIRRLVKTGNWTLRIDMEDFDGNKAHAEYKHFSIGDAASHFKLSIGAYSGNAGNSLSYHKNNAFTTKDSDHDTCRGSCSKHDGNCAKKYHGAWWYKSCHRSNLNGRYLGASVTSHTGMVWQRWKGDQSLQRSEMKIKRVQ